MDHNSLERQASTSIDSIRCNEMSGKKLGLQ